MNKQSKITAVETGVHTLIPLSQLLKSPRNVRKTPHTADAIEALAGSIAAKGILQNLVVEPETDEIDCPTGRFFVTIGEGRRLAQLLRLTRGAITDDEPIPCVIDTVNDPHEISLDENVTREAMHPADEFEAFRKRTWRMVAAPKISPPGLAQPFARSSSAYVWERSRPA